MTEEDNPGMLSISDFDLNAAKNTGTHRNTHAEYVRLNAVKDTSS